MKYEIEIPLREALAISKSASLQNISPQERANLITLFDLIEETLQQETCGFWLFGTRKKDRELELPAKTAAGFLCALAGGLLCIVPIPGIQGVGIGLVTTGVGLALDGIASGERPYYIDPQTGQKLP
jgi:hypothetical protein